MEIKAKAKFLRISPRKLRLIADLIQNMAVEAAADQLKNLAKKGSLPVLKLLHSAQANAIHNNKLKKENLFVKNAFVDQGPTSKRWRPRAFGRAGLIRKRTSHISVELAEREGGDQKKGVDDPPVKGKVAAKKPAAKVSKKPGVRKKAAPKSSKNQS